MKTFCCISAVLFFAVVSVYADFEATGIIVPGSDYINFEKGIWLNHFPSGKKTKISSVIPSHVVFSPDGKKIAYQLGNKLYTMNNDGSGVKGPLTDLYHFQWTDRGIIFFRGGKIWRYVPDSGQKETAILDLLKHANGCTKEMRDSQCGSGGGFHPYDDFEAPISASKDGRKMWLWTGMESKTESQWDCCAGRGSKPHIAFNQDYSDYKVYWGSFWGHGHEMTCDGWMIFIRFGNDHRQFNPISWWDYDNPPKDVYCKDDCPNPMILPAVPTTAPDIEAVPLDCQSGIGRCANKDSIIVMSCGEHNSLPKSHHYLLNWRSNVLLGEFSMVQHGFQEFWYGPLPNAHGNKPYISIDKNDVAFVLGPSQATVSKQVTVTNTSTAGEALQKVSASVSQEATAWLSATVEGSGGNTQTITLTVTQASLPGDVSNGNVTVSGGGAVNTVEIAVSAYKGETVAAPTGLTVVDAGDSLLDAKLTWTDNATNETGYIIERKKEGGTSWEEVKRVAADATTYTDLHLPSAVTYVFRVRAYKEGSDGKISESDNSNEALVLIKGIEWIRVLGPADGENVKAGAEYTVKWSANLVKEVRILLSLDGGLTFKDMYEDGGVQKGTAKWGNCPILMPETESESAIIKVSKYEGGVDGFSGTFNLTASMGIYGSGPHFAVGKADCGVRMAVVKSGILLDIKTSKQYNLRLHDASGRQIGQARGTGRRSVLIPRKGSTSGLYLIQGTVGDMQISEKYAVY